MLDPNNRSLLVDALRPPVGYALSVGLATTYALDLTTLLSVPLHLALFAAGSPKELIQDGLALLESLRRTTDKLAIFCQQGRIAAPSQSHVLYGLMERCVVEVNPPNGGVFHPKLWVLRFQNQNDESDVLLRLLVLSRNLTNDRSWDLSLSVEGAPGTKAISRNRPLADLVSALPGLAAIAPGPRVREHCTLLGDELLRTPWELPGKFESLAFHTIGLNKKPWLPKPSKRLAVVAPFVSPQALDSLAETTDEPVALISRPDELACIPPDTLAQFGTVQVLHESAETDDGEESAADECTLRGLHAKAYICEDGWKTTLYLGSANATNPSLLSAANVELLAELTGYKSAVGGIDALLGDDGLQEYLVDFVPPAEPPPPSPEEQAEKIIDTVRSALSTAGLRLTYRPAGDDIWDLQLTARDRIRLDQIESIRLWPISLVPERGVDATPLATAREVMVPRCATASATSFIAFELVSTVCSLAICFVLNVPVEGMPAARDAAIVRTIIANREGFLRYLRLLLQDFDALPGANDLVAALGGRWQAATNGSETLPLLEELTRAFSRNPDRLRSVRQLVAQLNETDQGRDVIPAEFLELWKLFDSLLLEESA